jgi:hypothetical protein
MSSKDKRSPLKEKPLRLPGQSLDDAIVNRADDLLPYVIYPLMLFLFALIEWMRWIKDYPPQPTAIIITIVAFIVTIFCAIRIIMIRQDITALKLGRDGERIVAENIQDLLKEGAVVLHDILGDKFNVDHVVISNHGIFVLETKTFSKLSRRDATISLKDGRVYADGYEISRNPIEQAQYLSLWIRDLLKQSTGKSFTVKPVVLFPGWFVEPMQGGEEVWMLNPKALPTFVANEPVVLNDSDVHLATFHLSRYIRTTH